MPIAPLFILLFLALAAYGQPQEQKRVAILNTEDDGSPEIEFTNLNFLTGKLREIAVKVLPEDKYSVMSVQSIIDKMGSKENARKMCREAECIAEIGRKVSAAYVGQARLGRFGDNLTINMELYNAGSGVLIGSFAGRAKDVFGLEAIINENAPSMYSKMPGVSAGSKTAPSAPSVAGGISGLKKAASYEADEEKLYVVNLSTEPTGAFMSFDGVPVTSCPKTPCKAELAGGNVRIIAALEQYDRADTTIFIKQNNQSISIRLKSSFGVLEIKPAYLDRIGQNSQWSLTINGKPYSLGEISLSPNKYSVKLSHECYENISFDVGINKGKREVFDVASNITLKKGGLTLSAERNGEPVSEPVFVNGKQVGETPFSGSVPLCAKVEIGNGKEVVDVKLKYNEKIKYTHRFSANKPRTKLNLDSMRQYLSDSLRRYLVEDSLKKLFTDSRDGKTYKMVKIGNQTWMAENLNYNASGSKCYDNQESNCKKYGRLYDWWTAKTSCPKGWHLPSDAEWTALTDFVGARKGGAKLKSTSGWNSNGNGRDSYDFAALPGGCDSGDSFILVGNFGYWWSASENTANDAYSRYMGYSDESVLRYNNFKSYLQSVRCVRD
ncbi:MAG: fibrobacter succinogenes major paralogous domain-containing protein [Fibromonadales bacterium]|nr:fibrobacter succinogenes major paralogous domain-containing protein [Fibromonadales bacterium]